MEQKKVQGEWNGDGGTSTVYCPIDGFPCEGACATINSERCIELCTAGKNWMEHRNNRLMRKAVTATPNPAPVMAKHGAKTFALKLKCDCDLCVTYKAKVRADQAARSRERRAASHDPDKPKKQWFTHGTKYGWCEKRCECLACLDHKALWYREQNRRRQLKKAAS